MTLEGKPYAPRSPADAVKSGVGFVPEERRVEGLILSKSIAFNVSLALRVPSHLYQGPLGVIPIAVMAIVFTLVYVKMGRLWPVIVAHGLLDFVGLAFDP